MGLNKSKHLIENGANMGENYRDMNNKINT
jgi:hypothetical protein